MTKRRDVMKDILTKYFITALFIAIVCEIIVIGFIYGIVKHMGGYQ